MKSAKISLNIIRAVVAVAATTALVGHAATPATDYFIDGPDNATPLLTRQNRIQLITYFVNSYAQPTSNILRENSIATAVDSASVTVKISDNSLLQVAPVVCGRDTLVAYIETVELPQADSNITFYRPGDNNAIIPAGMPELKDFIINPANTTAELPPIFTAKAVYNPERQAFIFTNTAIDTIARPSDSTTMYKERAFRFNGKRLVPADKIK